MREEWHLTHDWANEAYCVQDERGKMMKERLSTKDGDGDKPQVVGSENTGELWARSKGLYVLGAVYRRFR